MFLFMSLKEARIFHFRPLVHFSSSAISEINQLEVINNEKRQKITDPEAFVAACKSAIHPKQILSILPTNPKELLNLSGETLLRALASISILQSANKTTIQAHFITSHPSFEQLCRCLQKCSTMFTPSEMIRSLQALSSLKVPMNSEISLVLLNLLRHEFNYLRIEEIMQLHYVLNKSEKSSELQKAIEKAIPILFEIQVQQQIDIRDSTPLLLRVMNHVAEYYSTEANDETIIRVAEVLYGLRFKLEAADALKIVHSLCRLNRLDLTITIKLLSACIQILLEKGGDLSLKELLIVARRLLALATKMDSRIRTLLFSFLQSCCDRVMQEDAGLHTAISLQSDLKKVSYQSIPLLQYISDRITVNAYQELPADKLFTVVEAFSNNSYVPKSTDNPDIWSTEILPAILANQQLWATNTSSSLWLQFPLHLMILGHFDQNWISHVLKSSHLTEYLNRPNGSLFDLSKLLILYQTAAMNPNISMDAVGKHLIEDTFYKYTQETKCLLRSEIEQSEAGFVLSNVRTKFLHWIPTLMKINTETWTLQRIEDNYQRDKYGFVALGDVKCEKNEKLVSIDILRRYHMFGNIQTNHKDISSITHSMKTGPFRLRFEQLGSLGVAVCDVNYARFYRKEGNDELRKEELRNHIINSLKYSPYLY